MFWLGNKKIICSHVLLSGGLLTACSDQVNSINFCINVNSDEFNMIKIKHGNNNLYSYRGMATDGQATPKLNPSAFGSE